MAVVKTECYSLTCDGCGQQSENGDGFNIHYNHPSEAEGEATEMDWTVWKGHHWCERDKCVPPCICDHLLGEHDDDGGACLATEETVSIDDCEEFAPKETQRPA